ncbi:MAG: glycosyltransferase [Eubacteriaceae bacterium]|nr:glycosyltransferase [Eubacteriaceae bacterium]
MRVSIIIPAYNAEKYIGDMLTDVKDQTFEDFEGLVIDDGSTDGTGEIIKGFCDADERFRYFRQDNAGVSAARNKGLDNASGEYVAFYDADDRIPKDSLRDMVSAAEEKNADLVIGAMEQQNMTAKQIIRSTGRLSKCEDIIKFDSDLLWSFSPCNKLFRRGLIEGRDFRFAALKRAEDGIFTQTYIGACGKITGCDSVVYKYIKHGFIEDHSASQNISFEYYSQMTEALDKIAQIVHARVQKAFETTPFALERSEAAETVSKCLSYRSNFYKRYLEVNLLGEFYRYIWKVPGNVRADLADRIENCKKNMFPSEWAKVVRNHKDLRLEDGLMTADMLKERPLVTVGVSSLVEPRHVDAVLGSIYDQRLPAFRVLVDGNLKEYVDVEIRKRENLEFIEHRGDPGDFKKAVLERCGGKYVCFIDQAACYGKETLYRMYEEMERSPGIHFLSVGMKKIGDGRFEELAPMNVAMFSQFQKKNAISEFNGLDWMFSNKIFRTERLKKGDVPLTADPAKDIEAMFSSLNRKKMGGTFMMTWMSSDDIVKGCLQRKARKRWEELWKAEIDRRNGKKG